ncbi:hypothetical protein M5K25_000106 [Dendrobium thyrsiflorum]|uniref:Uncharacterized protein n=1 Tax=Dendrobium thyrsiflorum TaxID=117978 RepID=A0ABD0VT34_DENTH
MDPEQLHRTLNLLVGQMNNISQQLKKNQADLADLRRQTTERFDNLDREGIATSCRPPLPAGRHHRPATASTTSGHHLCHRRPPPTPPPTTTSGHHLHFTLQSLYFKPNKKSQQIPNSIKGKVTRLLEKLFIPFRENERPLGLIHKNAMSKQQTVELTRSRG